MKNSLRSLFFLLTLLMGSPGAFAQGSAVGVAPFQVSGPNNLAYLSEAAQDAIVGTLVRQGISVQPLAKALDPDHIPALKKIPGKNQMVVAGKIIIVGQNYRVRLAWIDAQGTSGQDYLVVEGLNELIPKLEGFAKDRLAPRIAELTRAPEKTPEKISAAPPSAPPAPVKKPSEEPKVLPKEVPQDISREEIKTAEVPEVEVPEEKTPPPPKPQPIDRVEKKAKAKKGKFLEEDLRDYDLISQRLPFEVRSLAYGDVDGDGKEEILLTSKEGLHIYHLQDGQLSPVAEYSGKNLDYFVKVDIWPITGQGGPWIVLTNLRGNQVASKLLKFSGGEVTPVVEEIPFQLRVVRRPSGWELLGSPYHAEGYRGRAPIFRLGLEGNKIVPVEKMVLPKGIDLYSFNWVPGDGGAENVVGLSPSGKLWYFKPEGKKWKKTWTSRDSYGGSGNWVPMDVKDFFNEVVADYYSVPVGLTTVPSASRPDLVVAKNDSLLKNVVGRVPVIADGQMIRLKWDELGFVEAWVSKKVDGSIQDYLIAPSEETPRLLAAVRLRGPGLFGDMKKNDSVLLIYNLN